jgi:predicted nucleic acid-binding protein
LLDRGERLVTTAINVEEIARGLRPDEEDGAGRLFAGLVILPIGADEGWLAGTWRREAARTGSTLTQADCLIAATATTSMARLATGNPKDFRDLPVDVEHWPVGE